MKHQINPLGEGVRGVRARIILEYQPRLSMLMLPALRGISDLSPHKFPLVMNGAALSVTPSLTPSMRRKSPVKLSTQHRHSTISRDFALQGAFPTRHLWQRCLCGKMTEEKGVTIASIGGSWQLYRKEILGLQGKEEMGEGESKDDQKGSIRQTLAGKVKK